MTKIFLCRAYSNECTYNNYLFNESLELIFQSAENILYLKFISLNH